MADEIVVKMKESELAKSLNVSAESIKLQVKKASKQNYMHVHSHRIEHDR
jgi:chaperonin cofactor prefoldin